MREASGQVVITREFLMNYNELSDGELNVLIAARVMGLAPETYHSQGNWKFANDLLAAWLLVDKYRLVVRPAVSTGWWCAAVLESGLGSSGCFTINDTYAEAPTAPRAICLSVLKIHELMQTKLQEQWRWVANELNMQAGDLVTLRRNGTTRKGNVGRSGDVWIATDNEEE